ncbi:DMT family transporter [Azospirillum sp. TSO35-2]|uniref:DMT family transporter n=1 Tax=Azospirillum sp. TSO35-2 TaxID=716796 RepID=UPI000D60DB8B|nr:DMT family transporter [Azospirillum sp. TSO35-2]PWC38971.1 hypothetical protein TSO352_01585 [Azospirillum sp. TSO35-2]
MPTDALIAVLFGAALHAGWNTAIKTGADTRLDMALVTGGSAAIALALLPVLPAPDAASVPYLLLSFALQSVYYRLLAAAYRTGDLSHAYPLMRGTAPLLVAAASGVLLGEALSATAWTGILLVCGGVLAITLGRGRATRRGANGLATTGFSLANAAVIASYTVVDGLGVRLSGQPAAYTLWLFLLTGLPLLAAALWRQPRRLAAYARTRWWVVLGGGACSVGSYGLALWAMTRAPVASAAALRETSILFALLLSRLVLKERVGPLRLAAGSVIALGAVAMRLPG